MKKLIDFKNEQLVDKIQSYADEMCEGNFNMAVRMLTLVAVEMFSDVNDERGDKK